jgi:hypothetical protein
MCRPTTGDLRNDFRLLQGDHTHIYEYDESSVNHVSRIQNLSLMISSATNGFCTGTKRQKEFHLFRILFLIIVVYSQVMFYQKDIDTNRQLSKIQKDILEKSDDLHLYRLQGKRNRRKCYRERW